jgi:uncharacterized membrane protein YphA (DoxX/SURF4 family)
MWMFPSFGRAFFAVALVGFGVQQFLFGDFVPGRAPAWPSGLPGQIAWAWSTGGLLIATGGAILAAGAVTTRAPRRAAYLMAGLTGGIIAAWALLRHVPLILQDTQFGGAWTMFGKALTLSTGAFAVATSLRVHDRPDEETGMDQRILLLGRLGLGAFMAAAGIQHFLWEGYVQTLVPAWIPGPLFWTYFAGIALIAAGVGLVVPATTRLAGTLAGLMVFSWLLMLHIPRAVAAQAAASSRNEWIAVFEALAVSGLALLLADPTASGTGAPQETRRLPVRT